MLVNNKRIGVGHESVCRHGFAHSPCKDFIDLRLHELYVGYPSARSLRRRRFPSLRLLTHTSDTIVLYLWGK